MLGLRSALAAPVATVLLLLAAPSAHAGTITIDYDLSGSGVSLLGGILNIPPDGSITSATAQVTVQGSSISNASAGAAQISNLALVGTVNGTVGGSVLLTGSLSGTQAGGGAGSLSGGLANLAVGTLTLNLNGLVNCFGGLCPALGTFPVTATNSLTVLNGLNFGVGGLGLLGSATLNAVLSLSIGGSPAVATLVGQEVGRTFIPEPNTFTLLALGCVGLAGMGWGRRRR